MKKLTPLITVDEIEPCLPFWTRLGFEVTATVPHVDALGFAMLQKDAIELMYQSRASLADDLPALSTELQGSTNMFFCEVESLDRTIESLGDHDVVVPRRQTFYGMDELFVRAPCGSIVGLAEPVTE
jgi:hypothetical protein